MEALWKTMLDWLFHVAPAFLIRWYWTEDRLRSRIIIDVRPRGDALEFRGGEQPKVAIYLRVWNMAPFTIEIDRLQVSIWGSGYGEVCQPLQYSQRTKVPPTGVADVFVRGGEGIDLEKRLSHASPWPTAEIQIRAEVNARIRNFTVQYDGRDYVRPRIDGVSDKLRQKLYS